MLRGQLYFFIIESWWWCLRDRLCGLVVRVPGCRPRGLGFDFRHYQIFRIAVCLERDPLSLVRINEELLEIKISGCGLGNRD
jgi:hypothetical protein